MSMGYGAAAGIVGGLLESAAAGMEQNKMGRAFQGGIEAQRPFQAQALGGFYDQLKGWSPEATQQALGQGAANRQTQYSQLGATPMSFQRSLGGAQTDAAAQAQIVQQAQQQAQLGAYGDWLVNQTIKNMGTQRTIGQASNFAAGTASLLPYQMYKAQHAYDWLQQIGQFISSFAGATGQSFAQQTPAPQMYTGNDGQLHFGNVPVSNTSSIFGGQQGIDLPQEPAPGELDALTAIV